MAIKLLCITDPATHPPYDTTVEIYSRLTQDSRFQLFHATPTDAMQESVPHVRVDSLSNYKAFRALDARVTPSLSAPLRWFDLVYIRADKPLPQGFLTALASCEGTTRFVNSPSGTQEVSVRSFLRHFTPFMPPSLFTTNPDQASKFLAQYLVVVAKREVSYGGKGVYRVTQESDGSVSIEHVTEPSRKFPNALSAFTALLGNEGLPLQIMRYLPRVLEGDKRVLVVDGQIYGAFLRRARDGGWVHNITAGGAYESATISPEEEETIRLTAHEFHSRGVYTLGYDFLVNDNGQWILSEINGGNVGGYGRAEVVSGVPVYARLFDWLLYRAALSC